MIVAIKGIITKKSPPIVWIETSAGLSYEILMPISCFSRFNEGEVFIHTHLIIREDAHSLFGFFDAESCNLFKMLIKINGVGAKTALSILSCFSMAEFQSIAINKDIKAMTKVPGIGIKTAERMMVDIAHFISKLDFETTAFHSTNEHNIYQTKQALITLGFKPQEVDKLTRGLDASLEVSDLIKQALANK